MNLRFSSHSIPIIIIYFLPLISFQFIFILSLFVFCSETYKFKLTFSFAVKTLNLNTYTHINKIVYMCVVQHLFVFSLFQAWCGNNNMRMKKRFRIKYSQASVWIVLRFSILRTKWKQAIHIPLRQSLSAHIPALCLDTHNQKHTHTCVLNHPYTNRIG